MSHVFTPKQKLEILEYVKEHGEKLASAKFNCSERTIYRWEKKFDGSIDSLENKFSRKGMPHPNAHSPKEIDNIKEVMRNNPYITHKGLYQILKNQYGYSRHPGSLYNYLRRNGIISDPKLKNDFSTMFNHEAIKQLNGKFLFKNKEVLPMYIIELNNNGIYIAKEENNNPCALTVYYSTALTFYTKKSAEEFLKSIQNTSNFVLKIKELKY